MKNVILLNSKENTRQVEDEEKSKFVRAVLETVGLPVSDLWDENNNLSSENREKLRQIISLFKIQILDYPGDELNIYHEQKVIATWKKPEYILKKDLNQIDPSKKIYLEMHCNYESSVIEEDSS